MASKTTRRKERDSGQNAAPSKSETEAFFKARSVLRPTVQGAATLKEYGTRYGDLDLKALLLSLHEQAEASRGGDLTRAEAMLTAQAHTLDAIFNNLAQQAINAEHMDNLDRYLKLALRAQSQCRATWETLATIKNPPMLGYVGQANISHGPQQVNNASAAQDGASGARENPTPKNKLLEANDGERLEFGAACSPSQADPTMAPMGEVDGAEDC